MKIKGAIFDMDGTLIDSLMFWDVMWRSVGEKYMGIPDFKPTEEVDKRVRTMIYEEAMAYFVDYYTINCDLQEFITFTGGNMEGFYRDVAKIKPGAVTLLKHLKQQGVRLCLASASDMDTIRTAMAVKDLAQYFDAFFSCADLGAGKDRPDIYLRSLEALHLDAKDVCVFEDSFVALETAKGIGCRTVGVFDRYNFDQPRLCAASDIYLGEGVPLDSVIKDITV